MASESLIPNSLISQVINLAVNEISNEKININKAMKTYPLNTYGIVSPTLKEQLVNLQKTDQPRYNLLINELLHNCKIIDYVDCVHDFKSCNTIIERILNITGLDLCSSGGNINVDKSHNLQDYCVKNMFEKLQLNNITIPTLNESFFIPTDKISEYIASKNSQTKFYLESGRTPNVDASLIQPKTIGAIYDGCAHTGISYDDVKNPANLSRYTAMYNTVVNTNIENYTITMYGGVVKVIFNPSALALKIMMTNNERMFIIITLINNVGITVNSILSSFPEFVAAFKHAERGNGNNETNYTIQSPLLTTDPIYFFLATCLKTVCDKVVSTEITPQPYIMDITTVDGYVWAGVTYKYLTCEYDILPTVYESVKNGWKVRPGIYNINQEISDSIIRVLHLLHLNKIDITSIPAFKTFEINLGIIESYKNMLKNYNTNATNCQIIIERTNINNVFDFISALKILKEYVKINNKIASFQRNLIEFTNNITPVNLLNINLLEDVLKNSSIDDAMNNQQTIIYNEDITYIIDLTEQQKKFMTEFLDTYKNTTKPATFMPYQIIKQDSSCDKDLVKRTLLMDDTQAKDVCDDFKDARDIAISSSTDVTTGPANITFEMDFIKAIQDELIIVDIDEILSEITFSINTAIIKSYSKTRQTTEAAIIEWFTNNVYSNLYDEQESVYIVDTKNIKITGPLEMEIIWILSMATMTRPLVGRSRIQEKEIANRYKILELHSRLLYGYLKPDYFLDDTHLGNFTKLYMKTVNNNIINNNIPYLQMWQEFGLPLPDYPSQIPILTGGIKNKTNKRKTKKQKKIKNKRKNKRNKTSKK